MTNIADLGSEWIIVDRDSGTYFGTNADLVAIKVPAGLNPDDDMSKILVNAQAVTLSV